MPGYAADPFGHSPFGRFDWSKQVLFRDLPDPDRRIDATVADGRLERFSDSIRPSFEYLYEKARTFGSLRDPDLVPTQHNGVLAVTLLSAEVDSTGRFLIVTVDQPTPGDPFDPLGDTSVGWTLRDSLGREYLVNQVHKTIGTIEVLGAEVPVTEATSPGNGSATLRPPSLIEFLGNDYGIEVDFHEPEAFQRSSVRNAHQWLSMKGAAKSYDILGLISGYVVTAFGLWRIDPVPPGVPSSEVFEIPYGSGKFYTTLNPTYPLFDEVAADVVPLDYLCFETPDWTSDDIFYPNPPTIPDGVSVGDAIGYSLQALPVSATTDLGGGRWRITSNTASELEIIAGVGNWQATFIGMPLSPVYVETVPSETSPGVWEFEIMAGTAPTFGASFDLSYECPTVAKCGYCRASLIRIEIVPGEILNEPAALLDGVLDRLIRKIRQVIPAHVRIAEIVHIVGPAQATLNLMVLTSASTSVSSFASLGYYYDIVPADDIEVDPDHMTATGTVFTIP